jgi:hypothetical protein
MATKQNTTHRTIYNPTAAEVLDAARQLKAVAATPAQSTGGWAPPEFIVSITTEQAQLAAGADYDAVLATTHDGELAARAYHVAYQRIARAPGGPGPVCHCDLCRAELSGV